MIDILSFHKYMRLAVDQAKNSKAEDQRSHPQVGAVILKDGMFLASAFRGEMNSGDHAEFTLIQKKLLGIDLKGSILITTLEPCTSRKTHKPCTDWIIEKELSRVFVGMLDPNPRVYSQGVRKLRDHGTEVYYFPEDLRKEIESDNTLFIAQFHANPELIGKARFNYSDNDGVFTIGNGECLFETKWSKASDVSIHLYNDPPSISGVAIAQESRKLADICDASVYDMSSRCRTTKEGDFVVLKNTNGQFAVLKILDVKDRSRADKEDELSFDYWILENGGKDFSFFA